MRSKHFTRHAGSLAAALIVLCSTSLAAQTLAVQLIDPNGRVGLMNEQGDVVGSRLVYPCPVAGTCAPVQEPTVWPLAGGRKTLPTQGTLIASASAISADGSTIVGSLTDFTSVSKAVAWRLVGGTYTITELGNLGLQQSSATGIDATGRVVGYAITPFISTRPFVWTSGGGMIDLAAAGAPAERIFSVSPGGRVLTDNFTFSLNNPAAAQHLPPAPTGGPSYLSPWGASFRVNDSGDLGGFNLTASEGFYYLYRWRAANATWQQLSTLTAKSGSGIALGVSRIDAESTIGASIGGALLAQGPSGLAVPLVNRLSPAYPPNSLSGLGYFNDAGVFLSNIVIGGLPRAVKLVPIAPCNGACLRVPSIQLTGTIVRGTPRKGCGRSQCTQATAAIAVTDASGNPMANATVRVRFMDSYTQDSAVSGVTNASGVVTLKQLGLVGAGTVSLLVESVTRSGWAFDKGVGRLTAEVIPR